jgi:hypothetical protein
MSEILFHYRKVDPTTWVYLSSLLTISLFFKFNRFWSVRNLDLALLILLAPGLLMVNQSRQEPLGSPAVALSEVAIRTESPPSNAVNVQPTAMAATKTDEPGGKATAAMADVESRRRLAYFGYLWLFGVSALWVVRLLIDPTMVRRPLLEPNLSNGGLLFMGCALFIFLMANVITSDPTPEDLLAVHGAATKRGRDSRCLAPLSILLHPYL